MKTIKTEPRKQTDKVNEGEHFTDHGAHEPREVPTILETPEILTVIVEKPEPAGPFGAKGISEVATVPVTPAITNAIYDAVGVRIYDLPATPAKILAGLGTNGH